MKRNAVSWFEIAVSDLSKAREFYEAVLQVGLISEEAGECGMLMFPFDEQDGVGGCLWCQDGFEPGPGGTMVYLNAEGDLDAALDRAVTAGGRLITQRTAIPPHGYFAHIADLEGNHVGLYSST